MRRTIIIREYSRLRGAGGESANRRENDAVAWAKTAAGFLVEPASALRSWHGATSRRGGPDLSAEAQHCRRPPLQLHGGPADFFARTARRSGAPALATTPPKSIVSS